MAATADSKALANVWACAAAVWACAAAADNTPVYCEAVDSIAAEAGPCQAPAVSPEVIDENDCTAVLSSADSPSQAAAAASIGPEPAPEYSNDEMTSGGDTKKLIPRTSFRQANLAHPPSTARRARPVMGRVFAR
ncbi:hypothetical protein MPRM_12110 [Mycobacterium parmense]|uniref:Uncharacterized protein n=1 Tax=Mycobacterium parmense TaxID=185642 RepID=A0A7I7YQ92_9MYCO|nr:hypothetical protein MPRM_12110 [Mycobacterium parmense]